MVPKVQGVATWVLVYTPTETEGYNELLAEDADELEADETDAGAGLPFVPLLFSGHYKEALARV